MINNKFSGIEKLSLVDFEGKIACTLFTLGCNFKCHFCHNKDLVIINNNSLYIEDEEIFSYLDKRKKQLDAVVITGGEPTLKINLKDDLKRIKDLGYLIKLDTNGSNYNVLKQLIDEKLIDYVAMDIKSSIDEYYDIIDIKNEIILDNVMKSIELLKSNIIDYEFRTTLVNEFHNEQNIEKIGLLLNGCKKIYLQKFVNREGCINQNLSEVNELKALKFKNILNKYIDNVYLRGY